MRAIPYLFILLVALFLVVGCMARTGDPAAQTTEQTYDPIPYTDRATGCEYLTTGSTHALTPRIAADGKTHRGCGGAQ